MEPQQHITQPRDIDIRAVKTPAEQFDEIRQNTLDQGILDTLDRQFKSTCYKFGYVLIPKSSDDKSRRLRNWDLWGPFFMCIIFGLFINNSQKFLLVLFTVLVGSETVAFNVRILGGQISLLQSVAILGYCIFPLFVIMLVLHFLRFVKFEHNTVKLVMVIIGILWSVLAARAFIAANLPQDRKFVGLYPIVIFYIFVGFLLYYI